MGLVQPGTLVLDAGVGVDFVPQSLPPPCARTFSMSKVAQCPWKDWAEIIALDISYSGASSVLLLGMPWGATSGALSTEDL